MEEEEQESGESTRRRRGVQWAEDVVDNEGMGKKKSKGEFETNCLLERGRWLT